MDNSAPPTNPRLWVLSELYYPEQTSTGYFLTRIAEGLAADFDVQVICGQPSYSERGIRAPRREDRNGARIHRMRATHFNKDNLLLRLVNVFTLTIAVFWFGVRRFRRGDRVLIVTNPPMVPIAGGLAARLRGCVATLLVHDVYPDILAATGMLRRNSLLYRLFARIFNRTFRMFDRIVVLGRDMAELVAAKTGGEAGRITIIPNWGDADEIHPIDPERNVFRAAHGLTGKFVVQFSGNIGRTHDVELLIEAARLLRHDKGIMFLFVGFGGKSELVTLAQRQGLENLLLVPRQAREGLGEMLAASDITVIPLIGGMLGLSTPSRMYNVMAAGVPVVAIAEPESELALTVVENKAGWLAERRNPAFLAELIRSLATKEGGAEARRRGLAGRDAVVARYTLAQTLEQYRRLFRSP